MYVDEKIILRDNLPDGLQTVSTPKETVRFIAGERNKRGWVKEM